MFILLEAYSVLTWLRQTVLLGMNAQPSHVCIKGSMDRGCFGA
jgi:hypothetical protein